MKDSDQSVLGMKPKRKFDLWKRDEHNEKMPLIIMGHGVYVKVNHVGAVIWQMCTGENTVEAIVSTICRKYQTNQTARVRRDTIDFLREFDRKGLLVLNYDPLAL
jgi:hypothetical protein